MPWNQFGIYLVLLLDLGLKRAFFDVVCLRILEEVILNLLHEGILKSFFHQLVFCALFWLSRGGLTVYIFGNVANVSDPTKRLALRVHDVLPSVNLTDNRNVMVRTSFQVTSALVVHI